jgi:DNA-binding MarR family transcriptional regulator
METKTPSPLLVSQLQQSISDLVRYFSVCDRFCTERLGITASQGYALLAVPDDESITMNALSAAMKLATSTMTRMVDQLIQKDLVTRQTDPEDRRVVRVLLTPHGKSIKQQLTETLQSVYTQVLDDIPSTEQQTILNSLESLNQAILTVIKACCGSDLCP